MTTHLIDRRRMLAAIGATGATVCIPPTLEAALPEDQVKAVHYYSNAGDSQGRRGQPMVNQSTNVVVIETESGLTGIGEYDTYRAGMLMNSRPDGSFMNW